MCSIFDVRSVFINSLALIKGRKNDTKNIGSTTFRMTFYSNGFVSSFHDLIAGIWSLQFRLLSVCVYSITMLRIKWIADKFQTRNELKQWHFVSTYIRVVYHCNQCSVCIGPLPELIFNMVLIEHMPFSRTLCPMSVKSTIHFHKKIMRRATP